MTAEQEVPLVIYNSEGKRTVIGKAMLGRQVAFVSMDEPEIEVNLTKVELPYSNGDSPAVEDESGLAFAPGFLRRPFSVEAVEVTTTNFNKVAALVGEVRKKSDGTAFIEVNRKIVPNVYRIYLGFWLTRLNGDLRAYSAKTFNEMFVAESQ